MHIVFTSVNANYLNRASILAKSVMKHSPEIHFVLLLVEPRLVLSGALRKRILENSPEFDEILTLDDFKMSVRRNLSNLPVVEACTAIKGEAMLHLLNRHEVDIVTYLDPDLCFYQSLDLITLEHEKYDVLLTPHLLYPPTSTSHILNDEIAGVAKHGVFNLGFISCKATVRSLEVVSWWADRLSEYCRVEYCEGLFTDQKWFDMAPAYFDNVGIVKHQGWNVAPWNFHEREIKGLYRDQLFFIHFSKFPSNDFFTKVDISGNAANLDQLIKTYASEFDKATKETELIKQMVSNIDQIQSINPSPITFNLQKSTGFVGVLEKNHFVRSLVNRGFITRDFAIRIREYLRQVQKPKELIEKLSDRPSIDVLILTHVGGGGVETIVQNEVLRFSKGGNHRVAILRPNYLEKGYVIESIAGRFDVEDIAEVEMILQSTPNLQVHHILGLEGILPKLIEHPNLHFFLHDRYFLSTQPFQDALDFLPRKPYVRGVDSPLNSKVVDFDFEWQRTTISLLKRAVTIYSPSQFIRNSFLEVDEGLEIDVVDFDEMSGYRHFGNWPVATPNDVVNSLKTILVISPTGPHKGIDVIDTVAKFCLDSGSDLQFKIYGSLGVEDLAKVENRPNIEIIGQLSRNRLIYSLIEAKNAVGWIPSLTGESYSLALSDFLLSQIPTLVSSIGALEERADVNSHIFKYSPSAPAEAIANWMMGRLDDSIFLLR